MFVTGNRFALLALLIFFILIYYTINQAGKGKIPNIRHLPALDAIEEAVGRAAEMGRPVHTSPGYGNLTTSYAAETLSGVNVVNYTARIAANKGADFICTVVQAPIHPLVTEGVRNAYEMEGESENFSPDMIVYVPRGNAYDSFIQGLAVRMRPAANIIVGAYWHAALFILESMNRVGAMSIGGTSRTIMTPFFIGTCDYFLMAEEVVAAGAYISENPIQKGSFLGQDYIKYILIALMIVGSVAYSLGSDILKQMLSW